MFNRDQRQFDPTAPCVYRVFAMDDHLPIIVLADSQEQIHSVTVPLGASCKPLLDPTMSTAIDHVLPGDEEALRRELMSAAGFHMAPAF